MLIFLLSNPALACGGLLPSLDHSEQLAASDALQAILDIGADQVTVDYRVHYTGTAEDFAWVIPVPGEVLGVAVGDETRFDTLAEHTAPQVNVYETRAEESPSGGCAWFGSRSKNDLAGGLEDTAADTDSLDVAVVGAGFAGDFQYTILDAITAEALSTWLTDHGYDLTYAAAPIAQYVEDPIGYRWVAVQLRPDVPSTPTGGVNLSPLRITHGLGADASLHAVYPSRMAATVQLPEVRTELFVLSDSHAVPGGGWAVNTDMFASGDQNDDPVAVYAEFLRSVGGDQPGLVEAWRGLYQESGTTRYLTRFDSIVTPATNTADVSFGQDGDTTVERRFNVELGQYSYGGWLPVGGLVLGLALGRRGERKKERNASPLV